MAKASYANNCGQAYDSQSGFHRCDWLTGQGWRCQGPGTSTGGSDGPGGDDRASACTGDEVFRDDFDGRSVDSNKWRTGFYWNPDGQANPHFAGANQNQSYVDSLWDPVYSVRGGNLRITPRNTGADYLSGSLTAKPNGHKLPFGHGCFETRAQFRGLLGPFPPSG